MVGLIQKILLDMIRQVADETVLNEIKKKAGVALDKEFQINLVYSDEEWQRLFKAAIEVLNLSIEEVEAIYADHFLKDSLMRFPTWFKMCKNSYDFLLIQPTIHNCFATGVADQKSREAINDKFRVEKFPNKIITHYKSPNKHCGLYIALAKCVINHYEDEAVIEEKKCTKQGDDACEIHVQWTKLSA